MCASRAALVVYGPDRPGPATDKQRTDRNWKIKFMATNLQQHFVEVLSYRRNRMFGVLIGLGRVPNYLPTNGRVIIVIIGLSYKVQNALASGEDN